MKRKLWMLLTALLAVAVARAADPVLDFEGDGTAANPYKLKTAADIVALAEACYGDASLTSGVNAPHFAGVCFELTADIDMAGVEGFFGIGSAPDTKSPGMSWYFAGTIDGKGHTVKNMKISGIRTDEATGKALTAGAGRSRSYVGFVGSLKSPGAIANLHLDSSCTVEGYTYTGSIAGYTDAGTVISDCSSAATVRNISKKSGGLVGQMKGTAAAPAMMTRCLFTGHVQENYEECGGLVGSMEYAVVMRSSNTGHVECESFNPSHDAGKQNLGGGIAGTVYRNSIVQECFNAGKVTVSYQKAGGITAYVKDVNSLVKACVNLGQLVTPDTRYIGAIVAHNFKSGSGANLKYGMIEDCYYDSQMWGILQGYQVESGVTALQTREMTAGTPLAGLSDEAWTLAAGFYPRPAGELGAELLKEAAATYILFAPGQSAADFMTAATVSTAMPGITATMAEGTWFKVEGTSITPLNPTEPVEDTVRLTSGDYTLDVPVRNTPVMFEGDGTSANPYIINDPKQLIIIAAQCNGTTREHYAGMYFRLDADLDMTGTGFEGIATKATGAFNSELSYWFGGIFDGNGHKITGIDINAVIFDGDGTALDYTRGSSGNVGLFGALGEGAQVRNLTVENASIAGWYNVGGIAGYAANEVVIADCRFSGSVTAYNRNAGGIVGATTTEIDKDVPAISGCIVRGSVRANSEQAGGIAGDSRADISGCVSLADVSVAMFNPCVETPKYTRAGGIAGSNGGNISACLAMGTVTCQWTEAGGVAGFNTNGYRMGNITDNIFAGQIDADDVSKAGGILGLDFRVTTSTSSEIRIEGNHYDSQYCKVKGSENIDKEGMTGMTTAQLTAATGAYPVPEAFADNADVCAAAATYLIVEPPYALYNFGTLGTLATKVPLQATIEGGDGVFAIDGANVTATETVGFVSARLTVSSSAYTRTLTLDKAGHILPGSGTEADPYIIATPADYNKVAAFVSGNRFDFAGKYFALSGNLDFTDIEITPLGSADTYFNGTLDGKGHTVGGIVIDITEAETATGVAPVGALGQDGVVKDLTVANSTITGCGIMGGIVAHCMGTVENCATVADVAVTGVKRGTLTTESGDEIGGIAGRVYPTASITGCENRAIVDGNTQVGGIAGSSRDAAGATIRACVNHGDVIGRADREIVIQGGQQVARYVQTMTGGIAGRFTGTIEQCENHGSVKSAVCDAVGGILGKAFIEASVIDCTNHGTVNAANAYSGGIVGISAVTEGSAVSTTISGCANLGLVTGLSSVGGIVGVSANGCLVTDSHNDGDVATLLGRAGGIIGEASGVSAVQRSYNTGSVEAVTMAAGIAADVPKGATLTVSNSFNTGSIIAGPNGGASGIANSTAGQLNATGCYNAGSVTAASFAGGIAGRSERVNLTSCYNAGPVAITGTRPEQAGTLGNIVGDATGTVTLKACYYLADMGSYEADNLAGANALTAVELIESADRLGDAYIYNAVTLPMLDGLDTDAARAYAAWYLPDGEGKYRLSQVEGVSWTATGPLEINGEHAVATAQGKATLTAACGDFSREHQLDTTPSGLDTLGVDDPIVEVRYFGIDGIELSNPAIGTVVVRVTVTASGRRAAATVKL